MRSADGSYRQQGCQLRERQLRWTARLVTRRRINEAFEWKLVSWKAAKDSFRKDQFLSFIAFVFFPFLPFSPFHLPVDRISNGFNKLENGISNESTTESQTV